MEDGINDGEPADVFGTSNRLFTADTIPASRWWDLGDSGIRIVDIRQPVNPEGPVEIDFEYFDPVLPWQWPSSGVDSDGDGIPDVWEDHYFAGLFQRNGIVGREVLRLVVHLIETSLKVSHADEPGSSYARLGMVTVRDQETIPDRDLIQRSIVYHQTACSPNGLALRRLLRRKSRKTPRRRTPTQLPPGGIFSNCLLPPLRVCS